MRKLLLALLLLPVIAFSITIDFGNIYPFTLITKPEFYQGAYYVDVNFSQPFNVYINASLLEDNPVIMAYVTNDTEELLLDNVNYTPVVPTYVGTFPPETKRLYYLIVLDFPNQSTEIYGENTLYFDIYAPDNETLLERVEIKFNALPETPNPNKRLPSTVRAILGVSTSIIAAGTILLIVKMVGI